MREALGEVDIEMRAEVASIESPPSELLTMQVGDVISLGPCGDRSPCTPTTSRCYHAQPGSKGSRRAVQIDGERLR